MTSRAQWLPDLGSPFFDAKVITMTRKKLSPHFGAAEFDCRDGREWPPAAREALEWWCRVWGEPLREAFGPVRVTSGFRHAAYNRSVGGASLSYHRYDLRYGSSAERALGKGLAADVVPSRGTAADWGRWAGAHQVALRRPPGRVGTVSVAGRLAFHAYLASGFIHLDTGPARTWAG